jgi:hypothetical protein
LYVRRRCDKPVQNRWQYLHNLEIRMEQMPANNEMPAKREWVAPVLIRSQEIQSATGKDALLSFEVTLPSIPYSAGDS